MKLDFISIVTVMTLFSTGAIANNSMPPEAPINAGAYNFTENSARLSFKDMADNETGFKIYSGGTVISTVDAKEGSDTYHYVNLTGLLASTLYIVDIVAYIDDNGTLIESSPLTKAFRTTDALDLPLAPTSAGAYAFTDTTARISFLDNATNEDGFKMYNGTDVLVAHIDPKLGAGEYAYKTLTALIPCNLYTIDIVAYNGDGESEKLTKSFVTTGCDVPSDAPLAPSNVGVYNITSDSARISFLDNASNEAVVKGFNIIDVTDMNNTTIMATLPRDRHAFEYQYKTLTGLMSDHLYTISVESNNSAGQGVAPLKTFRTLPSL